MLGVTCTMSTQPETRTLLRRYGAAKLAFEQALFLEPHNTVNMSNLALAHATMGNKAVAMEILQHVTAIDHTHKFAQDQLRKLTAL